MRRPLALVLVLLLLLPALTVMPAAGQADPASRALAHAAATVGLNAPAVTAAVMPCTNARRFMRAPGRE